METFHKILVVEDSEMDFELLVRYFGATTGFKTKLTRVETHKEFDDVLDESFDVVLSDYNVPGFGVFPALEGIKKRGLDIPLIVVSGEVGEESAVDIMHAGADDFVRKDNLSRLLPAVKRSILVSQMRKRKTKLTVAHERALEDRERLMHVVCHDIKNPLSSVRLSTQLLLQKTQSPTPLDKEFVREMTESILRSTERVDRLVQDLLEQSRIESGLFSIRSKKVSVSAFLKECLDAFKPLAVNKNLQLRIEMPETDFEASFDRDRILQVIGNLFSNALKYSPAEGTIVLGVRQVDSSASFYVSDSGPGIQEHDRRFIFSKFFQGKANKQKGYGLGLWIANELVRAHGGDIGFHSGVENKGTTFWFKIPLLAKESATQSEKVILGKLAPQVMIVDDDEDLSSTLCRILSEKLIHCHIANSYEKAVGLLMDMVWQPEDVVLVDYDLPEKNGGELIDWMRFHTKPADLPKIVLMSAHPDISERARLLKVKYYLQKPMDLQDVFELVQK